MTTGGTARRAGDEVVVTGAGAVTCHGTGTDALWRAMASAAARPPDRPRDPLAHMDLPLIHLVPDVPWDDHARRVTRLAVTAASEAVRDAGLPLGGDVRCGVVVGSCMGEIGPHERGRGRTGAVWNPAFRLAGAVGDHLGVFGPNTGVANACAAGGYALGLAADMIRAGEADAVVAGGADGYSRVALACFNRLGAVDPVRCRPFDLDRGGTVFGEGAGMLVLESRAHAERRGARPYARLAGSAWSCDAHHPTAPEPGGEQITRAIRAALRDAGAGTVGCVVPHGTGTRLGDVVESRALAGTLGPGAGDVPLYSLKALIGHTGGAAAALAGCAAVLMLRHGVVPPNVPLGERDPDCPVRLPQDAAVPLADPRVLVNGYGFGGNNASLVLEAAA